MIFKIDFTNAIWISTGEEPDLLVLRFNDTQYFQSVKKGRVFMEDVFLDHDVTLLR